MKINLGCGKDIKKGYVNVDKFKHDGVDMVHNLDSYPYPFKKSSIDEVYCAHIIEHLEDYERCIAELKRIVKPGGIIHIRVPHWTAAGAFSEFHKRWFWWHSFTSKRMCHETSLESGDLYDDLYLINKKLVFNKRLFWNRLIEPLMNIKAMPVIYEHTFLHSFFPAMELDVKLRLKYGNE